MVLHRQFGIRFCTGLSQNSSAPLATRSVETWFRLSARSLACQNESEIAGDLLPPPLYETDSRHSWKPTGSVAGTLDQNSVGRIRTPNRNQGHQNKRRYIIHGLFSTVGNERPICQGNRRSATGRLRGSCGPQLKGSSLDQPEGLSIAAVPSREDARDALISRGGRNFMNLPPSSRIGTSSLRRRSQLLSLRADIDVVPVRGNVDTRLRKLSAGEYDALVMAAAGVHRLGFEGQITEYFSPSQICPAAGQGALAVEIRAGNDEVARTVGPLNDENTHQAVRAERAALGRLGGGCQTPIAAYATIEGECIAIVGVVADPNGARIIRSSARGEKNNPEAIGIQLAEDLLHQGAKTILHD